MRSFIRSIAPAAILSVVEHALNSAKDTSQEPVGSNTLILIRVKNPKITPATRQKAIAPTYRAITLRCAEKMERVFVPPNDREITKKMIISGFKPKKSSKDWH